MPFHAPTRRAALAAMALLAALNAAPAFAQPGQTVKMIVPFTAGSGTDIVARLVGDKLGAALGGTVVVENRPGAGGTLGAAAVAAAPADGQTLLVHSAGHVVNPWIYPKLSYDTLKDFVGISPMAALPNVLVAAPGRFKDVADLVAQAKAKPGQLNYASAGNGSATHMNAEVFRLAAALQATHVPFRGTPEAMTETMAGRVDWFFAPLVSALPLIRSGKLQALAVGTEKRSGQLPEVPTTVEAGVPGSSYQFWVGLFAPAKLPRAQVDRIHTELVRILALPDVKERLDKLGAEAFVMAPADFDAFLKQESARAQEVVKKGSIRVE